MATIAQLVRNCLHDFPGIVQNKAFIVLPASRATCELVRKAGNSDIHPDVQLILGVHDETTRAESKLELA